MLTIHALYQQNQRQLTQLQAATRTIAAQVEQIAAQVAELKAANDKIARLTEQLEAERSVSRNRDRLIGDIEAQRDTQRAEADRLRSKHEAVNAQLRDGHMALDVAGVPRLTKDGVQMTIAERIARLVPPAYTGPVRKFPSPCEDHQQTA